MIETIKQIEKKLLNGEDIDFDTALALMNMSDKYIGHISNMSKKIQEAYSDSRVDLCTIMNAKSGRCTEDCKFCAQSIHYNTRIEVSDLVKKNEVLALAKENEREGVNRFSLVTATREMVGKDFEEVLDIYKELRNEVKMDLCASLGILDLESLMRLKNTGVTMYHHNLETSRDYYREICTTHSYDDRVETIMRAKEAGLKVCSGIIIGLGEDKRDRVSLAFTLKELGVESIPINILNPIKGTPLEHNMPLTQGEILKTISVFRMINKSAYIRLAGGRNLIDEFGKHCFNSGVNATITGNYLTTSGNDIAKDKEMLEELNLNIRKN